VTERARLGYAWDRTLFFVTGGYAGIDMKGSFNTTFADGDPGPFGSQTVWHNGGVVGAGIEYAITYNWTVKLEYLYASFQNATCNAGSCGALAPANVSFNESILRLGVNYKF